MKVGATIYLDYQASTPVDPRVLSILTTSFTAEFANPHAADHLLGWRAHAAVEQAARQIAAMIGCDSDEIVFTSGATEANNLAALGLAIKAPAQRRRILVSAIEHKSILAAVSAATRFGCSVESIGVQPDGMLDLQDLE